RHDRSHGAGSAVARVQAGERDHDYRGDECRQGPRGEQAIHGPIVAEKGTRDSLGTVREGLSLESARPVSFRAHLSGEYDAPTASPCGRSTTRRLRGEPAGPTIP